VDLAVAATAFALIFPVELPDKTFVASLVLATRYRPLPVWIGVSAAFFVQTVVAVTAGSLLSLLPHAVVAAVAGLMFLLGGVVLWRGAARADAEEAEAEGEFAAKATREVTGLRAASTSFGILFLAEWGDLSQLLTAGLAVVLGRTLLRYVRLATIRRVGAVVCLVLACVAAYDVIRAL
jgi:putative Ca2+/H+ antiporter (TMEM165/GDT1 family)